MDIDLTGLWEGELIRLAAQSVEDAPTLAAQSHMWSRRLMDSGPAAPFSVEKVTEMIERDRSDAKLFRFAIRTVAEGELIGFCGINDIEWSNGVGWLGIGIPDPDHWGKGYGREAMSLLLRFGFHELNLHRIALGVFSYNDRAIGLYKSLGFVHEGTERESLQRDGARYDMLIFGLLRSEWEAGQGRQTGRQLDTDR